MAVELTPGGGRLFTFRFLQFFEPLLENLAPAKAYEDQIVTDDSPALNSVNHYNPFTNRGYHHGYSNSPTHQATAYAGPVNFHQLSLVNPQQAKDVVDNSNGNATGSFFVVGRFLFQCWRP